MDIIPLFRSTPTHSANAVAGVITSVPVDDVTESSVRQRPIPYWGSRFREYKEPTKTHPVQLRLTRLDIINERGNPQTMLLITYLVYC